jgi:PHD/YefM family antitoxin component YafN of YafNO toxin-antitoxin module
MRSITSRSFNQDVSSAKRAADQGPVVITDRGAPAYVLMRHDAYQQLLGGKRNILQLLDMPGMEDIEFDPPKLGNGLFKPVDFS